MEEAYGSSSFRRSYRKVSDGSLKFYNKKKPSGFISVTHFFRTVFLPQGYPDSVSDDYLTYQVWDTIQAFASSITGTLAAQAVLTGVGVGDESATVLAATLTWLLKDGTGMLGRIGFAWIQGTGLDCDAKRWRLFADIVNDMAIFLEIMAPGFPSIFTFILCVAGVFKSIVGVAGGATRAALTLHQARRNNMAEVSAKDGSQETLVNLAALLCSFILVPIITGRNWLIWGLYIVFTSLHLYANYSAVTCVVMETINQSRLHLIVHDYFMWGFVPAPGNVNKREPVLWKTRRKLDIVLGASILNLTTHDKDITGVLNIYRNSQYILWIDHKTGVINISLTPQSTTMDQLQACYHAEIINFVKQYGNEVQTSNPALVSVAEAFTNMYDGLAIPEILDLLRAHAILSTSVVGLYRGQPGDSGVYVEFKSTDVIEELKASDNLYVNQKELTLNHLGRQNISVRCHWLALFVDD